MSFGNEIKKDTITNPMKERVLASVQDSADSAQQKVEEKQVRYAAAMKQLNIFQNKKQYTLSKLNYNNNPKDPKVQAEYKLLDKQEFEYGLEADISRFSLQSSLSFSGKMNQSLFMANAMLGS